MTTKPIRFFGKTIVYSGLIRSIPNLTQIKKFSDILNEENNPCKIILHMGDSKGSIKKTIYEMLVLRFGGLFYNEIILTSFLNVDFYNLEDIGIKDIGFIHLPDIHIQNSTSDFKAANYHKLLKDDGIREAFNHGCTNNWHDPTILHQIRKNIDEYGTATEQNHTNTGTR